MHIELLTPDQVEQVRDYYYGNNFSNANRLKNIGVGQNVTVSSYRPKDKELDYVNWGCHHGITSLKSKAFAIYSVNKDTSLDASLTNPFADYFCNRSFYAPFIHSTVEEYTKHGIIVDAGIPSNLMAMICINSRFVYRKTFLTAFNTFLKMSGDEDLSFMLANFTNLDDKTFYPYHCHDHGSFRNLFQLTSQVFYSWFRRSPAATVGFYRSSVQSSTNFAVYDLWDPQTRLEKIEGVKNPYIPFNNYDFNGIFENWVKLQKGEVKAVALEGLNPFQTATEWVSKKEAERAADVIRTSRTISRENLDLYVELFSRIKNMALDAPSFTTFDSQLSNFINSVKTKTLVTSKAA